MAAAMHLGLAIHNFGIQEYMKHGEKTDAVFQQSFTWHDGFLHPGDKPGLGVELDVDEAGKYPYVQRLPALQPARRRHRPRLVISAARTTVHLTKESTQCASTSNLDTEILPRCARGSDNSPADDGRARGGTAEPGSRAGADSVAPPLNRVSASFLFWITVANFGASLAFDGAADVLTGGASHATGPRS